MDFQEHYTQLILDQGIFQNIEKIEFEKLANEKQGVFGEIWFVKIFTSENVHRIVLKREPADKNMRIFGNHLKNFEKEVYFYKNIASKMKDLTAEVYYVDFDSKKLRYNILLEDLSSYEFLNYKEDEEKIKTEEYIDAVLENILNVHLYFLGKTSELPEYFHRSKEQVLENAESLKPAIKRTLIAIRKEYPDLVDASRFQLVRWILENSERIYDTVEPFRESLETMGHGDFKLDNLCFKRNEAGELKVKIFDWQQIMVSTPLTDLAYFFLTSFNMENSYDVVIKSIKKYLKLFLSNTNIENLTEDILFQIFHIAVFTLIGVWFYVIDSARVLEKDYSKPEFKEWILMVLNNSFIWIEKNKELIKILN